VTVGEAIHSAGRDFARRVALEEISISPSRPYAVERSIRYGELYGRTLRLIGVLDRLGIKPGDRIAVLLDNCIDMVTTEWACLLAGFVWVALNVRSSPGELRAILADSAPRALFYAPSRAELLGAIGLERGCMPMTAGTDSSELDALIAQSSALVPATQPGPEQPVRIRYTSGTAGKPKGAVLPRRCYDASLAAVGQVLGPLRPDDVLLQVAPMTHASGAMLLPHALVGARAVLMDRFDVDAFVKIVELEKVTACFLVPTMLVRLIEGIQDSRRLRSLRTIVYGGASMPADRLIKGLELLGPVFVQIYGLTESTWPVAALSRSDHLRGDRSPEQWKARLASCGLPTTVGELRIVGDDGRDLEDGMVGEIWVRGRNTMSGYWSGSSASPGGSSDPKGLDADGWMHTGDLGRRDGDGYVTIVDRLHDMIVTGGFNVYPREVEEALSSHDAVLEAAVVGRPSTEWGETVHAAVVLKPGRMVSEEELIQHCGRIIAGYKKPKTVELVAGLPKNPSGKILRREIKRSLSPAGST